MNFPIFVGELERGEREHDRALANISPPPLYSDPAEILISKHIHNCFIPMLLKSSSFKNFSVS